MQMRFVVAAALVLGAGAARAEDGTHVFRGYAYELEGNAFLYTEVHRQVVDGDRWLGGTIDYYGVDGARIGHKTLDFSQDPYVPLYRLDLSTRGGYMEGITALTAERIEMQKKGYGSREPETETVPRRGTMVADSGFHSFLRDHFADLTAGKVVPFTFVVAGYLDSFKFRARRIEDRDFEGRPAVQLKVESSTWLRLLADPLYVLYDPSDRRLLEYRGISNLHDPKTGKAWTVRIVYPSMPPADAPALPADA